MACIYNEMLQSIIHLHSVLLCLLTSVQFILGNTNKSREQPAFGKNSTYASRPFFVSYFSVFYFHDLCYTTAELVYEDVDIDCETYYATDEAVDSNVYLHRRQVNSFLPCSPMSQLSFAVSFFQFHSSIHRLYLLSLSEIAGFFIMKSNFFLYTIQEMLLFLKLFPTNHQS